jgi:hypothetical protein
VSEASMPPFINSTGLIQKILEKIQQAQEPERYTQDFQGTVLGYGSGSARPFIPFLKRLGLLESDGRPTNLYRKFRNADTAGWAMAQAIRHGFKSLYQRNEYAHDLTDDKLKNLVVEITGKAKSAGSVTAIAGSFKACKNFADFNQTTEVGSDEIAPSIDIPIEKTTPYISPSESSQPIIRRTQQVGMSFGYTINLNLPDTDDPKVFNAIFSALKETLLKE